MMMANKRDHLRQAQSHRRAGGPQCLLLCSGSASVALHTPTAPHSQRASADSRRIPRRSRGHAMLTRHGLLDAAASVGRPLHGYRRPPGALRNRAPAPAKTAAAMPITLPPGKQNMAVSLACLGWEILPLRQTSLQIIRAELSTRILQKTRCPEIMPNNRVVRYC